LLVADNKILDFFRDHPRKKWPLRGSIRRGGSRTAPTPAWQRGYDLSFLPTCLYYCGAKCL